MPETDGNWLPWGEEADKGWVLRVGPFTAQIIQRHEGPCSLSLNGQRLHSGSVAWSKQYAEWEIWNRVRQMIPAYRKIVARRPWECQMGDVVPHESEETIKSALPELLDLPGPGLRQRSSKA